MVLGGPNVVLWWIQKVQPWFSGSSRRSRVGSLVVLGGSYGYSVVDLEGPAMVLGWS